MEENKTETAVPEDTKQETPTMEGHHPYLIPGAIVLAGAFIGLGLFFANGGSLPTGDNGFKNNGSGQADGIRLVSEEDYLFGNPDAPVTIIEYSDFECPFCARFHPTVSRIIDEYDGQVNWVYRHFPLTSIHPEAGPSALASECVGQLAGDAAFWNFANALFINQASLGMNLYVSLASQEGVDEASLSSCMAGNAANQAVTDDYNEVVAAGGRGTPYSVVVSKSGKLFPVSGALPYEQVKAVIEQALVN